MIADLVNRSRFSPRTYFRKRGNLAARFPRLFPWTDYPGEGIPGLLCVKYPIVQRRVDDTSLRIAAGEIGVSYSGLRTFLKGTEPYAPTLAKLRAWYAQTVEGRAMTPERARAMLAALVESLPPERREEAVRELVERLGRSYRAAGMPVPNWLKLITEA